MDFPTTYALVVMNQSEKDERIQDMYSVRQFTESEYNTYLEYISQLEAFAADENLFALVAHSHEDLLQMLARHQDEFSSDTYKGLPNLKRIALDANRMVLNLLSSIRTYLDHTQTRLSRKFGKSSVELQEFKLATNDAFDSHFAYRFTEKLRNYAQHCGLPVGRVSLVDNHRVTDELVVEFDRDMLLNNFSEWGAAIKAELQSQPAQFDILPLLFKKAELLSVINRNINKKEFESLIEQSDKLLALIQESQVAKPGAPCIIKISGDPDHPSFLMTHFPYDIIGRTSGVDFNFTD